MKNLTLKNLAVACNGTYVGPKEMEDKEVTCIFTDSRKSEAGGLFVPIKGARVDAHDFIEQVMEKEVLATLSCKKIWERNRFHIFL